MVSVGIISEYNPFHNGHMRQIEAIRSLLGQDVVVVALMSGNFVQRGDFAILPKGLRAEAALCSGADLVLEFPYPWSGAYAQVFARAGVSLLSALSVDYLAFGSETGELSALRQAAENFASPEFEKAFAREEKACPALSHAVLRQKVYTALYRQEPPRRANDILGAAYLAALSEHPGGPAPLCIRRTGEESATASRAAYLAGDWETLRTLVPEHSFSILEKSKPVTLQSVETALLAFWRLTEAERLRIADLPADLAERMAAGARKCASLDALMTYCATKNYTNARIRRGMLSAILGVTSERLQKPPAYTRLLAANRRGRNFLAALARPAIARPAIACPALARRTAAPEGKDGSQSLFSAQKLFPEIARTEEKKSDSPAGANKGREMNREKSGDKYGEKNDAGTLGAPFPILTRTGDYRRYDDEVQRAVLFADRADRFYALADPNPPVNRPFIL